MFSMLMIVFGFIGKEDMKAAGVQIERPSNADKWKAFFKRDGA